MPVGLAALGRLGVETLPGNPFAGVEYVHGLRRAGADFAEGPGRVIRRLELSQALLHPQLDVQDRVEIRSISRQGSGFEVESARGERWRCKLLVGADGLHSRVRQSMGWQLPTPKWLRRFGWRQHYEIAPWNARVEIHIRGASEVYLSPAGPNLLGVAMIRGAGQGRAQWLEAFPELRERLGEARSPLSGIGPLCQRVRRVAAPGVVLIGDAAGYLDACTGEGLSLAFLQAEALGQHYPDLNAYVRQYRKLVRHYYIVTAMALAMMRLPALFMPVLSRNPRQLQRILSANQGLVSLPASLAGLALRALPALAAEWLGL
jgi:2-polyprenyl-6-methoxyphenol hydroxylase-like FAD-dependent oxidoreductase